ncbi:MAG: WYL domain-containing protein [Clostridiales bacterium]|nr:WYL domain-containing protein [Clostridiales bacterium]
MKEKYNMTADRKAIRRNILNLIDCGYHIEYTEKIRRMPVRNDKDEQIIDIESGEPLFEENCIWTDFYLKRDFTNGELRLLIDHLLSLKHVPARQCRDLIVKLEDLSNENFKAHVSYASGLPSGHKSNPQLFYNIEMLDDAISRNRKITFEYTEYRTDKKPHSRERPDDTVRIYKVTPYQMAAKEGKYYLICNYDKYNDISNYRVDRIKNICITEEPGKPFEQLEWSGGRPLHLEQYMTEHVYMFASETSRAVLRIRKALISDVIDLFGDDVRFIDETDDEVNVSVRATEEAVEQFAKTYLPDVVVLEPKKLAEKMKKVLKDTLTKYK